MTTVTAKQLRENLSEYLDRVAEGESIAIIRHSEVIGSLSPKKQSAANGQTTARAMRAFLHKHKNHKHRLDTSRPYKQLYDETLTEKYGTYTR